MRWQQHVNDVYIRSTSTHDVALDACMHHMIVATESELIEPTV